MLVSNSWISEAICSLVTTLRTPSLRQSPAGKSSVPTVVAGNPADDPLLNPDLDVLPDRAEGEAPESVGVERIIENGHQPHRSDGWIRRSSCLSALSGKRFERRGRSLLGRLDGKGSPLDGVACVLDADVDGLRQRPCCRCGHGGRDQQNDHGRESVLHVSSLGRRFDAVQQTRSGRIGRLAH